MIAVIDYGAGNLFSVRNALDFLGIESEVTRDEKEIRKADGLILPGVGAFPDAMEMLSKSGLTDTIREEAVKKPFLGICLGMQMLFEESTEFRRTEGLGLLRGTVDWIRSRIRSRTWAGTACSLRKKVRCWKALTRGLTSISSILFRHIRRRRICPLSVITEQRSRRWWNGGRYSVPSSIRKRAET